MISVRPLLLELEERTEGKSGQDTYIFLLGLSYQDEYSEISDKDALLKAIEYYKLYIEKFPSGEKSDFVRFNLAGAYADSGQIEAAIDNYKWLYQKSESSTFRTASRERMASLYINHQLAAKGIPFFLDVFSLAILEPDLRAEAATWLVQGYLAANESDKAIQYLHYLTSDSAAIYDPAFNVTLLKQGDRLFEAGNFDQAFLLYSFVKRRSEIIDFYKLRVEDLLSRISFISPESEHFIVVDGQLKAAQARLAAAQAIREYDVDMLWRKARVYNETGRSWESLWAYVFLYEDYPEHEQAEDFLYTAYEQARLLQDDAITEQLLSRYLEHGSFQKFRNQIVVGQAEVLSEQGRDEDLLKSVNANLENPESNVVAAQLINTVGAHYINDFAYLKLRDYMKPLLVKFQGKEPALEAARYWYALSHLLLAEYQGASSSLQDFLQNYDEQSPYYEDASYRYAIALYGEQRYSDSEAEFAKFVEAYPNSALRGEAELYLGDLKRDRGEYDSALQHYILVDEFSDNDIFVSRAAFSSSEVLELLHRPQQAVDLLKKYVKTYGATGALSDAYYRIGMIYDRLGQVPDRFSVHTAAIEELISDGNREAVDDLIVGYAGDYMDYDQTFKGSVRLLDRLIYDDEFRQKFLTDRVYQYQYMQSVDGVNVDSALAELLIRDRAYRLKIIERQAKKNPGTGELIIPKGGVVTPEMVKAELSALKSTYEEKALSIEEYDPQVFFSGKLQEGIDGNDLTMTMRAQMGLDMLSDEPTQIYFDLNDLKAAPPAIILWEAKKYLNDQPDVAKALYESVLSRHPHSKSVFEAYLALGDLAYAQALESGLESDWNLALSYYSIIAERYSMRVENAMPYLRLGRILSELSRDEESIEILGQILQNPIWGGLDRAQAHLELGLAYRRLGDWAVAHGFFERLIVAYGGFPETVSYAYYYDLLTLEKMGENESVEQLLAEYRTRSSVLMDTKAYLLIDEKYGL
ncbi:tetratricopeptide repeat protein [Rubellicoccus peritrichatus]|uniref:Tetratricopeptide repeat protein n=1 Tax=Rubellicoccus peritrichatus TaxID=3080537 RepID=A0AAQ3LJX4_9BACT|nr:tetratricopeptide repeat protein [Puniceicoccus sp. CR14]WOO43624.1 tetratricopeptide repeat protein [Puniceicoccus sp. CR14]